MHRYCRHLSTSIKNNIEIYNWKFNWNPLYKCAYVCVYACVLVCAYLRVCGRACVCVLFMYLSLLKFFNKWLNFNSILFWFQLVSPKPAATIFFNEVAYFLFQRIFLNKPRIVMIWRYISINLIIKQSIKKISLFSFSISLLWTCLFIHFFFLHFYFPLFNFNFLFIIKPLIILFDVSGFLREIPNDVWKKQNRPIFTGTIIWNK